MQPLERGRPTSMPRLRLRQTPLMGLMLPTPLLAMQELMQACRHGLPPWVAADIAGASPLGGEQEKSLLATGQTPPPTAVPTRPGKAAWFQPPTSVAATLRRPAILLPILLPLDNCRSTTAAAAAHPCRCKPCCCCCCYPAIAEVNQTAAAPSLQMRAILLLMLPLLAWG